MQPNFVRLVYDKLELDGYFHVATDWEDYADHIRRVLTEVDCFTCDRIKERPVTKFERRGRRLGHAIWDFTLRKAQEDH